MLFGTVLVLCTGVVLLGAIFYADKLSRDRKLQDLAAGQKLSPGCILAGSQYITGEFLPTDQILVRSLDCTKSSWTVADARRYFMADGFKQRDPSSDTLFIKSKGSYYYLLKLTAQQAPDPPDRLSRETFYVSYK